MADRGLRSSREAVKVLLLEGAEDETTVARAIALAERLAEMKGGGDA